MVEVEDGGGGGGKRIEEGCECLMDSGVGWGGYR